MKKFTDLVKENESTKEYTWTATVNVEGTVIAASEGDAGYKIDQQLETIEGYVSHQIDNVDTTNGAIVENAISDELVEGNVYKIYDKAKNGAILYSQAQYKNKTDEGYVFTLINRSTPSDVTLKDLDGYVLTKTQAYVKKNENIANNTLNSKATVKIKNGKYKDSFGECVGDRIDLNGKQFIVVKSDDIPTSSNNGMELFNVEDLEIVKNTTKNENIANMHMSVDNISFEMYNESIYQNWVDDMFNKLQENRPGFVESDVLELLELAKNSLEEEVNNNIKSYFNPATL